MIEIIALVVLIAVVSYAAHLQKKLGKTEQNLDDAKTYAEDMATMKKKANKHEKEISTLSLTDKRKRLSK